MDKLISLQQAFDALHCRFADGFEEDRWWNSTHVIAALKGLPAVQPEIIRCKDCAYCDSDVVDAPYGMTKKIFWCDRLYAGANENLVVDPDDFCSWAERREDAID